MCRGADTFGIPTRCHVVAGDVKHAWDKPGVTHARPVSIAGSNLASSVRGAYSSGFADLASRPQPCILTWIGTSIFHGTAHRALGLVSIAIGARVVDWSRTITATQVPSAESTSRFAQVPPMQPSLIMLRSLNRASLLGLALVCSMARPIGCWD